MSSEAALVTDTLQQLLGIGDLTLNVEAELDQTELSFLDVSRWTPGTIVALPSSAGETISIYAGGVRIGAGEVLVIDGVLSVRVSDLEGVPDVPDSGEAR